MASAPNPDLPLFYKRLEPISSNVHGAMKARPVPADFLIDAHAVPITVEEFGLAQRTYPIVFSMGPNPVPLALMGLNEGVNTYFDADGVKEDDIYVPAYIRRYPFMLAKLVADRDELTLCYDPSSGALVDEGEGQALFDDGKPSEATQGILTFCEQFEAAGQRTAAFMKELVDLKLLMDGEFTIQQDGVAQPFVYRGFQMINETALKELRGDVARRLIQSGALPLVYAHLFSLLRVQEIFARQVRQGKSPVPVVTLADPVGA